MKPQETLLSDLASLDSALDMAAFTKAVAITSEATGMSQSSLTKLCILNAGMGGLVLGGCDENGTDSIAFLRNVYRKLILNK